MNWVTENILKPGLVLLAFILIMPWIMKAAGEYLMWVLR